MNRTVWKVFIPESRPYRIFFNFVILLFIIYKSGVTANLDPYSFKLFYNWPEFFTKYHISTGTICTCLWQDLSDTKWDITRTCNLQSTPYCKSKIINNKNQNWIHQPKSRQSCSSTHCTSHNTHLHSTAQSCSSHMDHLSLNVPLRHCPWL